MLACGDVNCVKSAGFFDSSIGLIQSLLPGFNSPAYQRELKCLSPFYRGDKGEVENWRKGMRKGEKKREMYAEGNYLGLTPLVLSLFLSSVEKRHESQEDGLKWTICL